MTTRLSHALLRPVTPHLSHASSQRVLRLLCGKLIKQIGGAVTNDLLILLLDAMDLAFVLMPDYRRNIENFEARYVFASSDRALGVTVDFSGGDMTVRKGVKPNPTTQVTFEDAASFRDFLFSGNQDIFELLMGDKVKAAGNLNYIFKFGFMTLDLEKRLGIAV